MRAELIGELAGLAWLYQVVDAELRSWQVLVVAGHLDRFHVHVEGHILPNSWIDRHEALAAALHYIRSGRHHA